MYNSVKKLTIGIEKRLLSKPRSDIYVILTFTLHRFFLFVSRSLVGIHTEYIKTQKKTDNERKKKESCIYKRGVIFAFSVLSLSVYLSLFILADEQATSSRKKLTTNLLTFLCACPPPSPLTLII